MPDVIVHIPNSELDRRIREAAAEGARRALEEIAPRLDRALRLIEDTGAAKGVLTTAEAAAYADVKPGTVLDWIGRGLPANKRGGSAGYAIRKVDIDEWLSRR